jgi:hypothetical protein
MAHFFFAGGPGGATEVLFFISSRTGQQVKAPGR